MDTEKKRIETREEAEEYLCGAAAGPYAKREIGRAAFRMLLFLLFAFCFFSFLFVFIFRNRGDPLEWQNVRYALPALAVIAFPATMHVVSVAKLYRSMRDGTFFEDKTTETLVNLANDMRAYDRDQASSGSGVKSVLVQHAGDVIKVVVGILIMLLITLVTGGFRR